MRRLITTLATLSCILTVATAAYAQVIVVEPKVNSGKDSDFALAKASSEDANKAFGNNDIPAALAHAEAAYRAYPNASTAMQMAAIYSAENKHSSAFRWFLLARNHNPSEAFRPRIDDALVKHGKAAKLAVVLVKTRPADAKVSIDDGAGTTVGGRYVGLGFGDHTLKATAPDYTDGTEKVSVTKAGITTVNVALMVVEKPADPVEPPPEQGSIVVPLALVISGVVLAAGGAGLMVWGLDSSSQADGVGGQFVQDPTPEQSAAARNDYNSLKGDAEVGTYAGYGLLGVGGALLITGAVLWALTPSGSPEGEGSTDVSVSPALVPNGGGLVMGGRF